MSGQEITIKLTKRTIEGKAVRGLRRDGIVPAVIHDHGKDSIIVMGPFGDINKAYLSAGKHHPISVDVEGKKYVTLIKDVDFEPRKHVIRHVVFNAIKADEKQQTEIPLEYTGDAEAEKAGLEVVHSLDSVEIEALPKDLIDKLEIDISNLTEIGDKLTVADLKAPSGVTILTDAEHPIATVEEPKAQEVEEPETEANEGEAETDGEPAGDAEDGDKPAESTEEVKQD
jgi:large subunit ribosomal protein L25